MIANSSKDLKPFKLIKSQISERHRHRYEFNSKYLKEFNEHGMVASGINPAKNLVEIIELKNHPWFVGVQFHPELKSTVENPHPLFVNFVLHCIKIRRNKDPKFNSEIKN